MRSILTLVIFLAILVSIEVYSFKGLKSLISQWPAKFKNIFTITYWMVPAVLLGTALYMYFHRSEMDSDGSMRIVMFFMGLFVLAYVPKIVFTLFHLLEDLSHLFSWIASKNLPANTPAHAKALKISRSHFLTYMGLGMAAIPFAGILHGIFKGRFDYRVKRKVLEFKNLPASFDGLRIVQISDAHVGSFMDNKQQVNEALDLVNQQNPDILVFTGDMVNNRSKEADNWVDAFSRLKASISKFAILGNHDYGEYANWESEEAKQADVQHLIELEEKMGFRVLLNESVRIKRKNEEIALIGVENWGYDPFPQYGDLAGALKHVKNHAFKILLSHDPSHWDAEVLGKEAIDLTFSGHTHGMQFGIDIPGFKWSPVKYRYPRWAGLYKEGEQYLYVNQGFGYIAFPGRVNMPPEITVIDLKKA